MTASCVIYARQSLDRHEDQLAVSRQLKACRKFAAERGWTVAAELVDNDRSATSGKVRPEFERLLASRPERVVTWHTDRLVRLNRDLERVIALGVDVHAIKAGHLDLSNPAGRAVARTVTAWTQYEGEQKVLRQRAANDQRAEAGLPWVRGRAFGFESDGVTIRESEAGELRRCAEAIIRGRSLVSLAKDLNDREVRTAGGKAWSPTTLKAALLSPRNAGLRQHRGKVIGPAVWPAILDEETVAAARAVLLDPARRQRGPRRTYLLSGLMQCGECGAGVVGAYIKKDKRYAGGADRGPVYRCPGHVSRKAAPIDDYISRLVVARLSKPDAVGLFTRPTDDARAARLRDEREGLRGRLSGLGEAFADGDIDRSQLAAGTARVNTRLERVEAELAATVTDPTVAELATADDVAAAWAALPLETKRAVVGVLTRITVPRLGPARRFDPADLEISWRTS